ncbi:MAG: exosortase/archaeosortase family protein [Desulforegulaceae bacterium]|nr:exosortase/archaeosortase family protein [Desulforegulaceae bacterium]
MKLNLKKDALIQLVIITVLFCFVFFNTIVNLVKDWSIDDNFSHGFLIPFIFIYMVWFRFDELKQTKIKSSNLGIIIICLGLVCYLAGNLGAEFFVMRVSMITTFAGLIIWFLGVKIFKKVFIPVLYLFLMIPIPSIIWNKLAFPLQLFAASGATSIIQMFGLSVLREGNILHLVNTSLEVVDACSGLRSLTSLLALSGAFAYISPLKNISKWILFFSAIPIAVAVNILRLIITAFAAVYISPETAHGLLHDMAGIVVFGAALCFTYLLYLLLDFIENFKRAKI